MLSYKLITNSTAQHQGLWLDKIRVWMMHRTAAPNFIHFYWGHDNNVLVSMEAIKCGIKPWRDVCLRRNLPASTVLNG